MEASNLAPVQSAPAFEAGSGADRSSSTPNFITYGADGTRTRDIFLDREAH